jgi:hypothetical protein
MTVNADEPLRVDAGLLAHAAGRVLDAATGLADRTEAMVAALTLSAAAFGVLGRFAARAHEAATADARGTLERLSGLLEGDADKLYRAAFTARAVESRVEQTFGGR